MSDNDDSLKLQVYRSTGERDEITMSLLQTLSDLKDAIAVSKKLGCVPAADQRIFYLGRELKSNRSLEKLLGHQHGVNVIHFMAIPRNNQQQQEEEGNDEVQHMKVAAQAAASAPPSSDDDDDDDDDSDIEVIEDTQRKPIEMIDIADDDDSDNEEVQFVPNPKRRRQA
ncbi:hypothetical protein MPSEU_000602400 [Mayamaea pseudoterrestris]|nr:hypothetical protein MPSEU_000602400 [Mayamaea pseudoterrestris]